MRECGARRCAAGRQALNPKSRTSTAFLQPPPPASFAYPHRVRATAGILSSSSPGRDGCSHSSAAARGCCPPGRSLRARTPLPGACPRPGHQGHRPGGRHAERQVRFSRVQVAVCLSEKNFSFAPAATWVHAARRISVHTHVFRPYTIRKGDTLESIAQKRGLKVSDLEKYNKGLKEKGAPPLDMVPAQDGGLVGSCGLSAAADAHVRLSLQPTLPTSRRFAPLFRSGRTDPGKTILLPTFALSEVLPGFPRA